MYDEPLFCPVCCFLCRSTCQLTGCCCFSSVRLSHTGLASPISSRLLLLVRLLLVSVAVNRPCFLVGFPGALARHLGWSCTSSHQNSLHFQNPLDRHLLIRFEIFSYLIFCLMTYTYKGWGDSGNRIHAPLGKPSLDLSIKAPWPLGHPSLVHSCKTTFPINRVPTKPIEVIIHMKSVL